MRRTGRRVAAVLAAACMLGGVTTPAYADRGGPSAQDVARAKAAAAAKAEQAGQAKARLALADLQLAQLRQTTQAAITSFQAANARLATAQRAAARATISLQSANQQLDAQRQQMTAFIASTYRSGGRISMMSALLSSDGPQNFLDTANAINSISTSQDNALQRIRAAQITQSLAQQEASAALSDVQKAAGAAKSAKDAAIRAMDNQKHQVDVLAGQKAALESQAASLKSSADALQRQREANLERQRAAAEQARQRRALGNGGVDEENPSAVTGGPRPPATAAQGEEAVAFAKEQLGKPYQWGADGPDTYDCSGLTMMSWNAAGISIDHWSVAQYGEGDHVSRLDLRPGDLVFFAYDTSDSSTIHHVGIYVGNGQMIDAPHTGANVRYDPAFRSDYIGATRP